MAVADLNSSYIVAGNSVPRGCDAHLSFDGSGRDSCLRELYWDLQQSRGHSASQRFGHHLAKNLR